MRCPACDSEVTSDTCQQCGTRTSDDTLDTTAALGSEIKTAGEPARAADVPTLPEIPGLVIREQLGRGGFATVYRATHEVLGIDVAVKVFYAATSDSGVEQTLAEARLLARLDHPNLVRTFGAGAAASGRYVVMELMDGGSCDALRHLPTTDILSVAHQLLSALQALHVAGILHRDIKPANCLRRLDDSRVKLADLGLATGWDDVANHNFAGTLPFMAPELFQTPPRFSPSSDLYAMGMTLACMVLTERPYPRRATSQEIRRWCCSGDRPPISALRSDLPSPLSHVISRMIARETESRPASTEEVIAVLATCQSQSPEAPRQAIAPSGEVASPHQFDTLKSVGQWLLGERLYSSTNWEAFIASHRESGSPARLMRLKPDGPLAAAKEQIIASAERASELSHPNLAEVLDWGQDCGQAFVVTNALGRFLGDFVENGGSLNETDALTFFLSAAKGIAYLHDQGLVYQIIDPWAVVISSDGRDASLGWPAFCEPVGADARSKRLIVPAYAPPEIQPPELLRKSEDVFEKPIDLFSLGATFCFAVMGKQKFVAMREGNSEPSQADFAGRITAPLAQIIIKLMDDDPSRRPSAAELVSRLERIKGNIAPLA